MLKNKFKNTQLIFLIPTTLIFLAANSIICRAALINLHIDAYSFTFFRLFSASIVLLIILFIKEKRIQLSFKNNWSTSFMLFLYAITFSYAYINMQAGIGTLILFAVVQLTMIFLALRKKETLTFKKLLGVIIAFFGLVYLLYPNEDFTISLFHTILMFLSGIAWAFYSVLGKKSNNALKDTSENFVKSIFFLIIFYLFFIKSVNLSFSGIFLASLSGGLTSGIGYLLWYKVLKNMEIITASIIQLIVPVIAIFLSIIFLEEQLSMTLLLGTLLILSGIFISVYKKVKTK